jgi:hypothetical protein
MRTHTSPPASALLRREFRRAHACLDAVLDRLTVETDTWYPADTAASVGTRYAQIVLCEDLSVNGVLAAGAPLALSTWAGRTGLSELPALAAPTDWRVWARRVRLDLRALRPYARAVYAATDTYLATLPDEALDPGRDELRPWVLSALLLAVGAGRGEISCLMAMEGSTGDRRDWEQSP